MNYDPLIASTYFLIVFFLHKIKVLKYLKKKTPFQVIAADQVFRRFVFLLTETDYLLPDPCI